MGKDWRKTEAENRIRDYWDQKLKDAPGAYVDFPEGAGADAGRVYVVRPSYLSRIRDNYTIRGIVEKASVGLGTTWKVNSSVRAFQAFNAARTASIVLADEFVPGLPEYRQFVAMGGVPVTKAIIDQAIRYSWTVRLLSGLRAVSSILSRLMSRIMPLLIINPESVDPLRAYESPRA
jgi:hypothetical protein